MAKLLQLASDGSYTEVQPITTSAGAGDASKVAQTDSNGKWDISLMPTGVGADTLSIVASESLAAGDFVNIYNNAGTPNVRKANATDNTKPAKGFVKTAFSGSATALVYIRGINDQVPVGSYVAGDVGKQSFLSASTAGASTTTRPSSTGNISQPLGSVESVGATVTINFSERTYTTLL